MIQLPLEINEYWKYKDELRQGTVTRGVVVATNDPLFSGRVKVWVPILHGGSVAQSNTIIDDAGEGIQASDKDSRDIPTDTLGYVNPGHLEIDPSIIASLPWAYVCGSNWGPTANPVNPDNRWSNSGIYSIPKVGTEVFIQFEDYDLDRPIVIGAIFHRSELISMAGDDPMEISPSIPTFSTLSASDLEKAYQDEVSRKFGIITERNDGLFISDIPSKRQIKLFSTISAFSTSLLDDSSNNYNLYKNEYPNFSTTGSSARRITNKISVGTSDIVIEKKNPADLMPQPKTQEQVTNQVTTGTTVVKSYPVKCKFTVPNGGKFKADRTNPDGSHRPHLGIDLAVNKAELYAPIDCTVMACWRSQSAGLSMIIRGIDGFCHTFMHLDSVIPQIEKDLLLNPAIKTYRTYKQGTQLGVTGNTGSYSQGPHLHWEVFPGDSALVTNSNDAQTLRLARTNSKGATIKGINIEPYSFVDPQKDWLQNNLEGSAIQVQPGQVSILAQSTIDSTSDADRIGGLEMSFIPGQEIISLKHPSGSSITIDIDGNIKIFSIGDIVIKANRSLILDIFGGVLTNALAVYTRVKTVIKTEAANVFNKKFGSDKSRTQFPSIMYKLEDNRLLDMQDQIKASANNIFASDYNGNIKSIKQVLTEGFLTSVSTVDVSKKDYNNTSFDSLLSKYLQQNITKSSSTASKFANVFTSKILKAQMLIESNAKPNAHNADAVGLFQIRDMVIDTVKGGVGKAVDYMAAESNIDVATLYLAYLLNKVYNITEKYYANAGKDINSLSDNDYREMMYIALFAYNVGETTILVSNYSIVLNKTQTPSYAEVEQYYLQNQDTNRSATNKQAHLEYVPKIYKAAQILGNNT